MAKVLEAKSASRRREGERLWEASLPVGADASAFLAQWRGSGMFTEHANMWGRGPMFPATCYHRGTTYDSVVSEISGVNALHPLLNFL